MYVIWVFILLLVGVNLIILLSGKLYIYKGLSATYLRGHIRPSLYDYKLFSNRKIKCGRGQKWKEHPKLGKLKLSKNQLNYVEKFKPASLLIAKGDAIIYEKYWRKHNQKTIGNSFSMAKSVTGLLVGAALLDGSIKSIDEPVANYLDEFKVPSKNKITIRHVLSMSTGLSWNENYNNPFCDIAALYYDSNTRDLTLKSRQVEELPGTTFRYKSADT